MQKNWWKWRTETDRTGRGIAYLNNKINCYLQIYKMCHSSINFKIPCWCVYRYVFCITMYAFVSCNPCKNPIIQIEHLDWLITVSAEMCIYRLTYAIFAPGIWMAIRINQTLIFDNLWQIYLDTLWSSCLLKDWVKLIIKSGAPAHMNQQP